LKKGWKGQEEEEEDVSTCWMTLRKREDTGNSNRKHYAWFQASAAKQLRTAILLVVTQRIVVIS